MPHLLSRDFGAAFLERWPNPHLCRHRGESDSRWHTRSTPKER